MMAYVAHPKFSGTISVNRLSTMSYAIPLITPGGTETELYRNKYYTQWRWYWYHAEDFSWKLIGQVRFVIISFFYSYSIVWLLHEMI